MTEGMLRSGGAAVRDGRLEVAIHLPWYRSLPLSCLETVDVALGGVAVPVRSVAVPGFAGSLEQAAACDDAWDLRDPLVVSLDAPARPGDVVAIDVGLAVRIPYIELAPGVPLVHRAAARTEGILR